MRDCVHVGQHARSGEAKQHQSQCAPGIACISDQEAPCPACLLAAPRHWPQVLQIPHSPVPRQCACACQGTVVQTSAVARQCRQAAVRRAMPAVLVTLLGTTRYRVAHLLVAQSFALHALWRTLRHAALCCAFSGLRFASCRAAAGCCQLEGQHATDALMLSSTRNSSLQAKRIFTYEFQHCTDSATMPTGSCACLDHGQTRLFELRLKPAGRCLPGMQMRNLIFKTRLNVYRMMSLQVAGDAVKSTNLNRSSVLLR